LGGELFADDGEETLKGFESAFLADPEQAGDRPGSSLVAGLAAPEPCCRAKLADSFCPSRRRLDVCL